MRRLVLLVTVAAVVATVLIVLSGTGLAAPDPTAGNPSCFGFEERQEPAGQPGPGGGQETAVGVSDFTSQEQNRGTTSVNEAAKEIQPVQHERPCPEHGPFTP
jgi:hypothetical protein